jgi:hypothetical protein
MGIDAHGEHHGVSERNLAAAFAGEASTRNARATTERRVAQQIDTLAGQLTRVEIAFPEDKRSAPASAPDVAVAAPAPSPPSAGLVDEHRADAHPSPWSGRIAPTGVLGGVAVAGLRSGIVFSSAASSTRTDEATYRAQFPEGVCVDTSGGGCAKYQGMLDDEHRDHVIAVTAFAVAGVAAVSAACVLFWPRSNGSHASTWIHPLVAGRAASVEVGGSF